MPRRALAPSFLHGAVPMRPPEENQAVCRIPSEFLTTFPRRFIGDGIGRQTKQTGAKGTEQLTKRSHRFVQTHSATVHFPVRGQVSSF